jgi:hypothetical protein
MTVPYFADPVYRQHGLLSLLDYATTHPHSRQWISAILRMLSREGASHG